MKGRGEAHVVPRKYSKGKGEIKEEASNNSP